MGYNQRDGGIDGVAFGTAVVGKSNNGADREPIQLISLPDDGEIN